jgi:ABC-type glycerol-3-phosphate transport system permease component
VSGLAPPPRLPATAGRAPAAPNAGSPPDAPGRQPRSHGTHVAVTVAGLVAIGVVAWLVVSVVFTLLHVIELLLVAALAAWAGYRVGYFRGRRRRGP